MKNSKKIKIGLLFLLLGVTIAEINPFSGIENSSVDSDNINSSPKWVDTRFRYRKNVTIQAAKVSNNLTNFPLLIDLYDKDLKNVTQTNGNDLIFADASTHIHLVAWVKANLSCIEDTIVSIYYCNTSIDSQESTEDVWDEDFVAIWHLSETTVPRYDSTKNNIDASPQNYDNDEALNGKIDGADSLDGIDDYIETYRLPDDLGLGGKSPKTVSSWVYTRNFNGGGVFEFGKPGASKAYFSLGTLSDTNNWRGDWGGTKFNDFNCSSLNKWIYFVVVYDGDNNIKIYADNQIKINENDTKLDTANDLTLKIGKWENNCFNGILDEVRVSTVARSDDWIKTEYHNQYDPYSFYSIGFQEVDENSPIINDFGVDETFDGHLKFYANLTDDIAIVEYVTIKINGTEFNMVQNESGIWVYQYSEVNFGDYFVYQIVNASDSFGNHLTKISMEKNFTFTKDISPPRVNRAYFLTNDELSPTNLTFFAEIEEYDSGIDVVILLYYFEVLNETENSGGSGSSLFQDEESQWFNATMEFCEKSDQYHIYTVTVPFSQNNSDWKVIYSISTSDYSGNIDENAFSVDYEQDEGNIIVFYPSTNDTIPSNNNKLLTGDFIPSLVLLNIILLIIGITIVTSIYAKFLRKPVLVGLDRNLILKNMDKVSDSKLKASINKHTLGIVLSYFDQRTGPLPLMALPISLDKDSNLLLKLSSRAFSNCELVDNFHEEKEAIFNFTNCQGGQNIKSLSYSFSLNRPGARNDAENITLSILILPEFFQIIYQFFDNLSIPVKKIHKILDENPENKMGILNELDQLRKMISRIIISYSKLYDENIL
ncbi:MAG: LamG-like jellyroll fold domain-containing protein [Candidatus Hodarchaeales archaeon]|jgi:hypothetical protein